MRNIPVFLALVAISGAFYVSTRRPEIPADLRDAVASESLLEQLPEQRSPVAVPLPRRAIVKDGGGASGLAKEPLWGSGYTVIEETSSHLSLNDYDTKTLILSKLRFADQAGAEKFCKNHNSRLDKKLSALSLATSGAASGSSSVSKFIKDAITFEFKTPKGRPASGVWSWSGEGNTVFLMFDGRGSSNGEYAPIAELNELLRKTQQDPSFEARLPAICVAEIAGAGK